MRRRERSMRLDVRPLVVTGRSVIATLVTEPPEPAGGPCDADEPENHEDGTPFEQRRHIRHQRRCDAACKVRSAEEDALHTSPLLSWNPAGEDPRRIRPCAGFADSE